MLLLCLPIPRTHRSCLSSSQDGSNGFQSNIFSLPICWRRMGTYVPAFSVNVSVLTSINLAYVTCLGLYQLSCAMPRKCAVLGHMRLGRSPTLENRVRGWPGCFPVGLTKTRIFWEGKPQLWTYLHQIVFQQVCSAFSWLMIYVGGSSLGQVLPPLDRWSWAV